MREEDLIEVIRNGTVKEFDQFLDTYSLPAEYMTEKEETLLMLIAKYCQVRSISMAEYVLNSIQVDEEAYLDAQDIVGNHVLHHALLNTNPDRFFIKKMLDLDVYPDIKNHDGITPLLLSVLMGDRINFNILLNFGADPEEGEEYGITIYDLAIIQRYPIYNELYSSYVDHIINKLIYYGYTYEQINNERYKPVLMAIRTMFLENIDVREEIEQMWDTVNINSIDIEDYLIPFDF